MEMLQGFVILVYLSFVVFCSSHSVAVHYSDTSWSADAWISKRSLFDWIEDLFWIDNKDRSRPASHRASLFSPTWSLLLSYSLYLCPSFYLRRSRPLLKSPYLCNSHIPHPNLRLTLVIFQLSQSLCPLLLLSVPSSATPYQVVLDLQRNAIEW